MWNKYYKWTYEECNKLAYSFVVKGMDKTLEKNYYIQNKQGKQVARVRLVAGTALVTVMKGYSWDGCSPKYKVKGNVIGIWDGFKEKVAHTPFEDAGEQQLYYPSMVHDILCQLQNKLKPNISRKQIDDTFFSMMKNRKFMLYKTYYLAVRMFSKIKGY